MTDELVERGRGERVQQALGRGAEVATVEQDDRPAKLEGGRSEGAQQTTLADATRTRDVEDLGIGRRVGQPVPERAELPLAADEQPLLESPDCLPDREGRPDRRWRWLDDLRYLRRARVGRIVGFRPAQTRSPPGRRATIVPSTLCARSHG
jgi:hypothetical protein